MRLHSSAYHLSAFPCRSSSIHGCPVPSHRSSALFSAIPWRFVSPQSLSGARQILALPLLCQTEPFHFSSSPRSASPSRCRPGPVPAIAMLFHAIAMNLFATPSHSSVLPFRTSPLLIGARPRSAMPMRLVTSHCRSKAVLIYAVPPQRHLLRFRAVSFHAVPSRLDSVPGRCSPFLFSSRPCHATAALAASTLVIASPVQGASL